MSAVLIGVAVLFTFWFFVFGGPQAGWKLIKRKINELGQPPHPHHTQLEREKTRLRERSEAQRLIDLEHDNLQGPFSWHPASCARCQKERS